MLSLVMVSCYKFLFMKHWTYSHNVNVYPEQEIYIDVSSLMIIILTEFGRVVHYIECQGYIIVCACSKAHRHADICMCAAVLSDYDYRSYSILCLSFLFVGCLPHDVISKLYYYLAPLSTNRDKHVCVYVSKNNWVYTFDCRHSKRCSTDWPVLAVLFRSLSWHIALLELSVFNILCKIECVLLCVDCVQWGVYIGMCVSSIIVYCWKMIIIHHALAGYGMYLKD